MIKIALLVFVIFFLVSCVPAEERTGTAQSPDEYHAQCWSFGTKIFDETIYHDGRRWIDKGGKELILPDDCVFREI